MVFEIADKVAFITGGSSGIGLEFAKELLRKGVKGVAIADIDVEKGEEAVSVIHIEFGHGRAMFVKTDVSNHRQFEFAILKTLRVFGNIDILINNAGIQRDQVWNREIQINMIGTIHGMILGMDRYLTRNEQTDEALIVNISSIAGITPLGHVPIYSATKAAIIAMTRSWGTPHHYKRSKVRVIAICPGGTSTNLVLEKLEYRTLGEDYSSCCNPAASEATRQTHVAEESIEVMKRAESGTVWIIEGGEPAYQYIIPNRETMKENTLS